LSQTQNNLLGLPQSELQEFFQGIEEKNYRAKQLMQWIYAKGVYDFNLMTNFNFNLREYLNKNCTLGFDNSNRTDRSKDGTVKWLIEKQDQQIIETVFIPEESRGTLCISSQIGCLIDCPFCATGHQGFNRNLKAHEIIGQILVAKESLGPEKKITNVVFMGMGEPLANYPEVIRSIKILNDSKAGTKSKTIYSRIYIKPDFENIEATLKLADMFYESSYTSIKKIPFKCRFSIIVARRVYRQIGRKIMQKKNMESYEKSGKIYVNNFEKIYQTILSLFDLMFLYLKDVESHQRIREHEIIREEINLDERI
jgi:adenine C2-methylase RlmN of 23S rRNA A2503 and tRNA A37